MTGKKILVIEDEQDVAKVLVKRLSSAGYETILALDASMGVREAHKSKPHLIVLDLMLPGGGGLSVLKNLKMSTHTMSIPILVLTGSQDEAYKKKVLEAGVEAFMQKPYEIDAVLSQIKDILTS
jgi:DNA-binding response OmpR family regulator